MQYRSSGMRRRAARGFTLMEVVVAITLMALVMSVLLMGLRLGASALQRGQQKLEAKARALASLDVLQRQVAAAAPHMIVETSEHETLRYISFRGTPREARFLTAASWHGDRARPLDAARDRGGGGRRGGARRV